MTGNEDIITKEELAGLDLRAPFPYFGGKSLIADEIWRRFGALRIYIEPFGGSLAVLLKRPPPIVGTEIVNDMECYIVNFWRALKHDPCGVAEWGDWPIIEQDLAARHKWLVEQKEFRKRIYEDPDYYDVKIAGWWVWGQGAWLGSGFCKRAFREQRGNYNGTLPSMRYCGIHRIAYITREYVDDLSEIFPRKSKLLQYMKGLARRLRNVIIACGDWKRVCDSKAILKKYGENTLVGVFLDPPYSYDAASNVDIYNVETSPTLRNDIIEWCHRWENDPMARIALCGYEGEYDLPGWSVYKWTNRGGYNNQGKNRKENRLRERVWFSPSCLNPHLTKDTSYEKDSSLFGEG